MVASAWPQCGAAKIFDVGLLSPERSFKASHMTALSNHLSVHPGQELSPTLPVPRTCAAGGSKVKVSSNGT